jgi:hypothetical protein
MYHEHPKPAIYVVFHVRATLDDELCALFHTRMILAHAAAAKMRAKSMRAKTREVSITEIISRSWQSIHEEYNRFRSLLTNAGWRPAQVGLGYNIQWRADWDNFTVSTSPLYYTKVD